MYTKFLFAGGAHLTVAQERSVASGQLTTATTTQFPKVHGDERPMVTVCASQVLYLEDVEEEDRPSVSFL